MIIAFQAKSIYNLKKENSRLQANNYAVEKGTQHRKSTTGEDIAYAYAHHTTLKELSQEDKDVVKSIGIKKSSVKEIVRIREVIDTVLLMKVDTVSLIDTVTVLRYFYTDKWNRFELCGDSLDVSISNDITLIINDVKIPAKKLFSFLRPKVRTLSVNILNSNPLISDSTINYKYVFK